MQTDRRIRHDIAGAAAVMAFSLASSVLVALSVALVLKVISHHG